MIDIPAATNVESIIEEKFPDQQQKEELQPQSESKKPSYKIVNGISFS